MVRIRTTIVTSGFLGILLSAGSFGQTAAPASLFAPAPGDSFPAGANPRFVVAGDFNNDQISDLAVVNPYKNTVTVLLGSQTGVLTPGPTPNGPISTGGSLPSSVAAVYFHSQTNLDLAVTNATDGTITILLGDGTGNFTKGMTFQLGVGTLPVSIAAADFNGDGFMDLAVANAGSNSVTVLFGDGTGNIMASLTKNIVTGIMRPVSVAVGNFAGYPGIAVANEANGSVAVLLGDGNGNFTPSPRGPFPVAPGAVGPPFPYPAAVAVADLNNDGYPDIITANSGTNSISILLGNALGGFTATAASPIVTPMSNPSSIAVSDFNQDGIPDLAIANYGVGSVTVLLGDGTGAFKAAPGSPYPSGASPASVAAGDFNGDGEPDLVAANQGDSTVAVFLNQMTPTLTTLSAASWTPRVAPGSIASILGSHLATAMMPTAFTALAPTLGGTSVTIRYSNGTEDLLPLYYVSPGQINAMIPSTAVVGPATLTVISPLATQTGQAVIVPYAPGLFSASQNGAGVAMATFTSPILPPVSTYQCGTPTTCVPVPLDLTSGGTLTLFGTGLNGATAQSVAVTVGGQGAPIVSVGNSGIAGKDQVVVQLPSNPKTKGIVPVMLSVTPPQGTAVLSNVVTILIQ